MKKGIGFIFVLLLGVSCSREGSSEKVLKNAQGKNHTKSSEVDTVIVNQVPKTDTVVSHVSRVDSDPVTKPIEPAKKKVSEDPFSGSFSGGSGFGSGSGTPFAGKKMDKPSAPKVSRNQLTKLDRSQFVVKQSIIIFFDLTIDEEGNVVEAIVNEGRSHTSDQAILKKVTNAVIKEVKYNSVPETPLMTVKYKVFLEGTEMPVYVH